ncbi:MAG: DUF4256 domain-containing protein [Candidatus Methylacidiphilales bacterium]
MIKELPTTDAKKLIETLKIRFEKHVNRHSNIDWAKVQAKLELSENKQKLWSLNQMEITGGEPDVIDFDTKTNEFIFVDCSAESPSGRRSLCFDHEALDARKENKPLGSALNMAAEMGITILSETQYRNLSQLGNFDAKTSSWIETPAPIRKLGGALFADFRYNHVFVYHNGAQSYYAARGFRGMLKV